MMNDKKIVLGLNKPIEITQRPFAPIAERLGISQDELFDSILSLKQRGVIRRFGAILGHKRIGLSSNALVAWSVPGKEVARVADKFTALAGVSHCYLRQSYRRWPYNLYTMVHAKNKKACSSLIKKMSDETGITEYRALLTLKEFKKTKTDLGAVLG